MLMKPLLQLAVLTVAITLAAPSPAHAYMGPGLGLSALMSVVSMFGAMLLGLLSIIWYPLKRLFRRLRRGSDREDGE